MDIIEFAEKYFRDSDGKPIHLQPWQKEVLKAFEAGEPIFLNPPSRIYGRSTVRRIAKEWYSKELDE